MFRKFGPNDIIRNALVAHPKTTFFIYESRVYYNDKPVQSGSFGPERLSYYAVAGDTNVQIGVVAPLGNVSLYEYNIDRIKSISPSAPTLNQTIYPYLTKDGSKSSFKTVIKASSIYNNEFDFGDTLAGIYPMTASIRRDYITTPHDSTTGVYNQYFVALKNKLNLYGVRSRHYKVTSSYGDKSQQTLNLIHIPSIFYGQRIRPGSLSLKWYFSGSLIGELRDTKQNGELIQVSGTYDGVGDVNAANIGNVAGVALYDEGLLLMTGSWDLSNASVYLSAGDPAGSPASKPQWIYWGAGAHDGVNQGTVNGGAGSNTFMNAAFELSFEGTTKTQVLTMYAHADKGKVNYSNNPTFIEYGQEQLQQTSSHVYEENSKRLIKNTVSSSYSSYSASFKRQVYISKVAVYDAAKNLIGVATLSSPVLKEEEQDYTFKIKLDL
jgi:hypothetical protein